MTQYVIVAHNNETEDNTYFGPYPDNEYMDMYDEIKEFHSKESDPYQCYILKLETFTSGVEYTTEEFIP